MTMFAYPDDDDNDSDSQKDFQRVMVMEVTEEWVKVEKKKPSNDGGQARYDPYEDEEIRRVRRVRSASIRFVDSGRREILTSAHKLKRLHHLPLELQERPFLAVEIILVGLKPLDDDLDWTPKANHFVERVLDDSNLEGP